MANQLDVRLLLLLSVCVSSTVSQLTFPSLAPPILRSCWELYEAGYRNDADATRNWVNGLYEIDPDGIVNGEAPFQVYCDLSNGETVINHDQGSATSVPSGNADPGSYSVPVTYNYGSEDQIIALIEASDSCSQSMTFECTSVPLWNEEGKALTWWISRDEFVRNNWGAPYNTRGCSCSQSTCDEGQTRCNCDVGDAVARSDTGIITDKDLLPIKELKIGGVDTGDQLASYQLGDLKCSGSAFTYRSCEAIDADTNSWALPNYYMIDPDGDGGEGPFPVFCDTTGETLVPHSLCDMGARTPGAGVTDPDCAVDRDGSDTYAGEGFEKCEAAGCDSVDVIYNYGDVAVSQMVRLIEASTDCKQDLQVTCSASLFTNNRWWEGRTSLVDRFNFGGETGTTGCDNDNNGITDADCECNKDDAIQRVDTGTIEDEDTLPIVKIYNGDTEGVEEYAFINVGALHCEGNELLDECATNVDNCDTNALCTDTDEKYECACNEGYWGNGFDCQPILFYLECDDFTVIENELSVQFNVWRTGNNPKYTSSVQVDFENMEAEFDMDFSEENMNVVFPTTTIGSSNAQFVPISVNIVNDDIVESNETLKISLSDPVNGMVQDGWFDTAIVNIINDDTSFEIELDKYEASEEVGYVDITIIRKGFLDRTGSVVINSTEDTAKEEDDFAKEGTRTISFTNWEERKTVRISLLNDRTPEETEVFWVGIEQPFNGLIVSVAVTCITVMDHDTTLCPEKNLYTVLEGDTSVDIKLLRMGDTSEEGYVRSTAFLNGINSLRIPLDQEELDIPEDTPSISIRIDLSDDLIQETTENITFYIIEAGDDHVCPERWVVITISDDDSSYALSNTHYTAEEGPGSTVEIRVNRYGYLDTTGTCNLATSHVTDLTESAVAGLDYVQRDTTVSFSKEDSYKSVFITILNDNFKEAYEAFVVTLSDCTNGALIEPTKAYVGIIDDDVVEEIPNLPTFTIAAQSYDVFESEGLVTVTINKEGSGDASVRIATYPLESSASVTQDFQPINELLEFTDEAPSLTVSIPIVNDEEPEETETIVVKLSNPIKAYLGDIDERRAVISVKDLDSIVYFRTSEVSVPEGSGFAQVEVVREGYLQQPEIVGVRLAYTTFVNEANFEDFTAVPTSVSFDVGQTSAVAEIPIIDDEEIEGIEIFKVRLAYDDTGRIGPLTLVEPNVATVHILDDDEEGPEEDSSLALIIGGSVAGGLIFIGVAGLALAVCFKALASSRVPQRLPPPPKYLEQPPQPLVEFPRSDYGYPPALNRSYNSGYPYPR